MRAGLFSRQSHCRRETGWLGVVVQTQRVHSHHELFRLDQLVNLTTTVPRIPGILFFASTELGRNCPLCLLELDIRNVDPQSRVGLLVAKVGVFILTDSHELVRLLCVILYVLGDEALPRH